MKVASNHSVYVGLGSNLNDPEAQLRQAIAALAQLPETRLKTLSAIYRSHPVGPQQQPDYLNAVAYLDTRLKPEPLLDRLQQIEAQQRRVRTVHWGPRTIDLDILLYDDQEIVTDRLVVPHPYLQERNFVLLPLLDICPEMTLPNGTSLSDLATAVGSAGLRYFADADSFYP